ncbi:MAG: zinc-ribbon domain-containing protein [Gammaproteobacteria bacterium]|nr:zinc-ribbon domain-containing protein [Gammaproteobacteria bacterium]MDE2346408.1 zinc-ribbon domain-containing protein [Gammaproteobacteria bacterium]
MLTTCTACSTQFRVSTAQLRAVHGLVRCSRCHSVFDAFETLREEFEAAPAVPQPVEDHNHTAELPQSLPAVQEAPKLSADTEPPVVDPMDPEIQLHASKTPAPTEDLFADLWGEPAAAPAQIPEPEPAAQTPEPETPMLIEDRIPKPPALARDQALYKHVQLQPREKPAPKIKIRPVRINLWWIGNGLLLLLLIFQVINAQRVSLSQVWIVGRPLEKLYSALGAPIAAPVSPDIWQVSNINVTSDPEMSGALSITGALADSAVSPVPWPVLRVELLDRYGEPLRARDFVAADYLPANQAAARAAPGTTARFRIDVVDPGPDAVGFQVQPCVDADGSRICSSSTMGN